MSQIFRASRSAVVDQGSAPAECSRNWRPLESPRVREFPSYSLTPRTREQRSAGDPVGTFFHATGRRRPTRLLWLAHATEGKGVLRLDDGAVRALTQRRASLLPAGLVGVEGSLVPVIRSTWSVPSGEVIARGLVNYDATELPGLMGRSTRDLARELGSAYEREVVHRDDLVILSRGG